jgi:hypothetical protein
MGKGKRNKTRQMIILREILKVLVDNDGVEMMTEKTNDDDRNNFIYK